MGGLAHGAYRPVVSGFAKELCMKAAAEHGVMRYGIFLGTRNIELHDFLKRHSHQFLIEGGSSSTAILGSERRQGPSWDRRTGGVKK